MRENRILCESPEFSQANPETEEIYRHQYRISHYGLDSITTHFSLVSLLATAAVPAGRMPSPVRIKMQLATERTTEQPVTLSG